MNWRETYKSVLSYFRKTKNIEAEKICRLKPCQYYADNFVEEIIEEIEDCVKNGKK